MKRQIKSKKKKENLSTKARMKIMNQGKKYKIMRQSSLKKSLN
jgi:hypothetical protein